MKRIILSLTLALLVLAPAASWADEGMWLLSLIGKNYPDMQKAGFKLTPQDIYSINQGCLKDAIVGLGEEGHPFSHFCTGEIISNKGLMTTNHHCGFGKIQEHSTVEHDYLRDGFWAYTMAQELPNPGMTASILVRMEDVTDRVLECLSDDMSESDRSKAVSNVGVRIIREATEGTDYEGVVQSMFNGNQYFLFVYCIYKDVRLVGAPPSAMGKFGGDTDNWAWPRHTCDFSMFRIYTAPDGKPAAYAKENIPLKPKHHLPVSARQLKSGDFAMVMGFPGTTNRFVSSYGLKETMDVDNPIRYDVRTVKINILREQMASDPAIRIKYATKYAHCSNYWKYSNEQNIALKKLNTMAVKQDIEDEYYDWALDKDPKYRQALPAIKQAYADRREVHEAILYYEEGLLSGPEMLGQAIEFGESIKAMLAEQNLDKRDQMLAELKEEAAKFYKDYDENVEKAVMAAMMEYTYRHINVNYVPECLKNADRKYRGDFTALVNYLFNQSFMSNQDKFNKFLKDPNLKVLERDELYKYGTEILARGRQINSTITKESRESLRKGERDFVDGLLQINSGRRLMAPDANSSIRLTYGNVKNYDPRDGVTYHHYTTLDGVMQKEVPGSTEFTVPERLKELYAARDFGGYVDADGNLPTCFITTNDITGGNSGSPVMDAYGNLIGLAFDGNGESMSGDIDFEENLQRCICLDTRYMLFVIDRYANAQNLIAEMDIVR
ncbi:MAG: S46 family peptidase [Bacteroidales bacterium]|nr:S46 family peptidase [Bacteroidales bacterium]